MFVGVPLPDHVRGAVVARVAALRGAIRARWVRPEALHVTLCFLGDVPASNIPDVERRVAAVVAGSEAFRASLGGVGTFGRGRRPATVWLGIGAGSAQLARLSDATTRELTGNVAQPARPHVTLAREVAAADVARFAAALAPLAGTTWPVDAAVLFRSHLGPGGSRYDAVATLPLRTGTEST